MEHDDQPVLIIFRTDGPLHGSGMRMPDQYWAAFAEYADGLQELAVLPRLAALYEERQWVRGG